VRTLRIWMALCCSVALVVGMTVGVATAQVPPGGLFDTTGFAIADGGNGGSARGGDGGNGGTGVAPICSQNTSDAVADVDPETLCGAGGLGGDAGDAGVSEAGDGGVAFTVGGAPPAGTPAPNIQQLLADLFVRQRQGSVVITVGNNGPDPANGVQFSTTVTASNGVATFAGISAEGLTCTSSVDPGTAFNPESPAFTVTCTIGDLAPGQTVEFRILWVAEECFSADVTSAAHVSAASPADPDLSNNSSTFTSKESNFGPGC
jgi:hypothetical protein